MRKVGKGGTAAFSPTVRPNVFSPVGVEDVIERQGESVIWFRMQPCPCDPGERLPECRWCLDGQIKTYQKTALIEKEIVKANGRNLYPRYAPVTSVKSAKFIGVGQNQPVTIQRIEPEVILTEEVFEQWHGVELDYEVSLIEKQTVSVDAANTLILEPEIRGVIVSVVSVHVDGQPFEYAGHTMKSVTFPRRLNGKVTMVLEVMEPIKIAYRTFEAKEGKTESAGILAANGDLELIVPQKYIMGPGDIVTFLTSEVRASHYVKFQPGSIDRLQHFPVIRIENCMSQESSNDGSKRFKEYHYGEDFILLNNERIIWLTEKPFGGYTIMYTYRPSFRIQPDATLSGGMDRRLPRQYKAKLIS